MAPLIVAVKFERLRAVLERIENRRPDDLASLERSEDAQDILVVNLARAVQLRVDVGTQLLSNSSRPVPDSMADVFGSLVALGAITPETAEPLTRAVGFRNIAVHRYERIDWEIVFRVSRTSLDVFRCFAREVDDWLERRPAP